MLYVVYDSGQTAALIDVSLDQAGHMVQMYPRIHIFEEEDNGVPGST